MDLCTRFVLIVTCCVCAGHLAHGGVLDVLKNVVRALTGNKLLSDDQTQEGRRFLEQPAAAAAPSWSNWGAIAGCTVTCGTGFAEVQRTCSTGNLRDCEALGGTYWKLAQCVIPCGAHWMTWVDFKPCSVTCGVGVVVRRRECSTGITSDCKEGKPYDFNTCNPVECATTTKQTITTGPPVWSEWGAAKSCSATCGDGYSERERTCSTGKASDCTGKSWKVITCNVEPCAVDGIWGDWTAWGQCTATCGTGNRYRSKKCVFPVIDHPGQPCSGSDVEGEDCNTQLCAVDGVWSSWSVFSTCSVSCGSGIKIRNRDCAFPDSAPHGANCSGSQTDVVPCDSGACPVDGHLTAWSSWTPCTKTCDKGYSFRNRFCQFEDGKPHGKPCNGKTIDARVCNNTRCPVDGVLSQWASWSQCSHTCNGGLQFRSRVCTFDSSAPRGADCVGNLTDSRDCGMMECPVDGTWGQWGQWSQCTSTCGSAVSTRQRTCEYRSATAPHGKVCPGENFEKKNCSDTPCPVDGTWTTWTKFSQCSVTCGTGQRSRTRTCTFDDTAPRGQNCTGSGTDTQSCRKLACPVDGQLTSWGIWSLCVKTCGNGTQVRSRDCYFPSHVPHGQNCVGALSEVTSCNEDPCPVTTTVMTTTTEATANGSWSTWSAWTTCSLTCGKGSHQRVRTCTYPDHTLHGEKCPGSTTDTQDCSLELCPVDGAWSAWSLFGACSASCGNGTHTRTRTCTYDARFPKGHSCNGTSTDTGDCFAGACPIAGSWGAWGAWSACPVTCGRSVIQRTRICEYQDGASHGADCPGESHENQTCSFGQCPVDGKLSEWTTWTTCPVTCGNGTHTRNRTCIFPPGARHGADCIGELNQTQLCSSALCPVDGVLSEWTGWNACTKRCGGGIQQRNRFCHYDQHAPHGKPCQGATTETQDCSQGLCPVDGIWGAWGPWSLCSATCEEGTHWRSRPCSFLPGVPHGKDCVGSTNQTEACNLGPCPVDGVWSDWSAWTACSASCGNGTSSRDRSCYFPPGSVSGTNCSGSASEQRSCSNGLCAVDGVFGAWTAWTSCPVTCGGSLITRQRQCQFDSRAPRGLNCTGESMQSQNCSTDLCPVDGTWSAWSEYTNCSVTCGNGTRLRKRKCEFPQGVQQGNFCVGHDSETIVCSLSLCPVDGYFSTWSDWSNCSKPCNNGTQSRSRRCQYDDTAPPGNPCVGPYKENRACHVDPCPINGHWSDWTAYSACSASCGNGTHSRNRSCIYHDPAPHGSQCFGATNETSPCTEGPCAVDGAWTDWTEWSNCSLECGGGKSTRGRICHFQDGVPKGANCTGNGTEIQDCNKQPCPVDGQLSQWADWSGCSVTCGPGSQFRTRQCTFPDLVPRGKDCNATLSEQAVCNLTACTVDGQWSTWNTWGACGATCGNGTMSRSRDCVFPQGALRGANCTGSGSETTWCNIKECPVDGIWGLWSPFSSCTKSCGNGTATRSRSCDYPDGAVRGASCVGDSQEVIRCNTTDCREDGVWGVWSSWSSCSASCGDANKTRSRTCTYPTSNHGDTCLGDATDKAACNNTLCPVNGTWTVWQDWSTCSASCGSGIRTRIRNCTFDPVAPHGDDCSGSKQQQDNCKLTDCTVNGVWSQWTVWTQCSQTCENGTESRTRNCVFSPSTAPRGNNCTGDGKDTRVCTNSADCPVNGNWGAWTSWTPCNATCGAMDKQRSRQCEFDANKPRGHDCFGQANETVSCGLPLCPVDGTWSTWQTWTACSITCGKGGTRTRSRTCTFPDNVPHGQDCTGNPMESTGCDTGFECPVSGFWEEWGRWHHCSATCGGGHRTRTRNCVFPPHVNQGSYCQGTGRDSEACNTNSCS